MASAHRISVAAVRTSLRSRADPGYICRQCQRRALSTSRKNAPSTRRYLCQPRRYASDGRKDDGFEGSFADKIRKKIWGTDNPPGQRNPYVHESQEEREDRLKDEEEREMVEREQADFARMRQAQTIAVKDEDILDDVAEEEEQDSEKSLRERTIREVREYQPATTWKGLRHVPGWKVAQGPPEPWFKGYLAPQKAESLEVIERAIQRAVVEVMVIKQNNGSVALPAEINNPTEDFESRLATGVTFNGKDQSLTFTDLNLQEDILRSLGLSLAAPAEADEVEEEFEQVSEDQIEGEKLPGAATPASVEASMIEESMVEDPAPDEPATEESIGVAQSEAEVFGESLPLVDPSYRFVTFDEPNVKFAVLKRVMQLTGTRLPDPSIARINTASDLLTKLTIPPPNKRLVDDLLENETFASLPNVQLFDGRYNTRDKEEEIGRWKLIEKELTKRGLPLEMRDVKQRKKLPFDAPNPHFAKQKRGSAMGQG